jgi:hypothetical protein
MRGKALADNNVDRDKESRMFGESTLRKVLN